MTTGEFGQERKYENKALFVKQIFVDQKRAAPFGESPLHTESITAELDHIGSIQRLNSGSAITFTIPPDAAPPAVDFAIGDLLVIGQWGAGQASFVAGSGVTLRYKASLGLNLLEQYSIAWALKVAANEWWLSGDLSS